MIPNISKSEINNNVRNNTSTSVNIVNGGGSGSSSSSSSGRSSASNSCTSIKEIDCGGGGGGGGGGGSGEVNSSKKVSPSSSGSLLVSCSTLSTSAPPPTSHLKNFFDRGTADLKFGFGFLKRRNTEGALNKKSPGCSSSSSSSMTVRPSPEEAAKWGESFSELMKSKYGQTLFTAFLKREFCEENIEFWLAVDEYRTKVKSSKLQSKANKIVETFILVQSPKEINIDSDSRESIIAQIVQNKSPKVSSFDQLQTRIQSVLESDAYMRFLKSDLYLELIHPERYIDQLDEEESC